MAVDIEAEPEIKVSTLMGGIVHDARRLFMEQLTLFQVELKHDMNRALQAFIPLLAGMMVMTPSIVLLGAAAAFAGNAVIPEMPLWATFAIVGSGIGLTGTILVLLGLTQLNSMKLAPEKALEGLKENLQWKTKN